MFELRSVGFVTSLLACLKHAPSISLAEQVARQVSGSTTATDDELATMVRQLRSAGREPFHSDVAAYLSWVCCTALVC